MLIELPKDDQPNPRMIAIAYVVQRIT
jgi:hypothetical protein